MQQQNVYHLAKLILIIISVWTISAAYFVNIESADGYSLIANAKYFLGQKSLDTNNQFFPEKMPINSVLLIPAEWLKTYLNLPVFDVRIHHLLFGIIHALYLWSVYLQLRNHYIVNKSNESTILIAFLATIPSFIFFSYAPFLSVDIYPGAIFLFMLLLTYNFSIKPSWNTWIQLIIWGSAAPLIKQIYVVFWIVIIAIYGTSLLLKQRYRTITWLITGAFASAIITWLLTSLALTKWDPQMQVPFLLLPYHQFLAIVTHYKFENQTAWPWWFYLSNLPTAYGIVTTLLIIPGIMLAIRGKDLIVKHIALAWSLAFIIMLFVPYREMRYLAFLAPLTAFVIIPPINWILQYNRIWAIILLTLLSIDLIQATSEATIIYNNFFSSNPIVNFLRVIDDSLDQKRPIIMPLSLSFTSQPYSQLAGDRFHRCYHIHLNIIKQLYNHPNIINTAIKPEQAIYHPELLPQKTVLLLATNHLYRSLEQREHYFATDNTQLAAFKQCFAYRKVKTHYVRESNDTGILLVPNKNSLISLKETLTETLAIKLGFSHTNKFAVCGFRITALCEINSEINTCKFYP